MTRLVWSIARLFAILTSLAVQPTMAAGTAILVKDGIIFSAEKTAEAARRAGISEPYWTPTEEDIERVERAFVRYVKRHSSSTTKTIASSLPGYKRQYLGYVVNGEALILINAFCKNHWEFDNSWESAFVDVLDGGDCYFQIRYKASSSAFFDLQINGES